MSAEPCRKEQLGGGQALVRVLLQEQWLDLAGAQVRDDSTRPAMQAATVCMWLIVYVSTTCALVVSLPGTVVYPTNLGARVSFVSLDQGTWGRINLKLK